MGLPCYKALLFDLDGTLVDSVELHLEAWRRAMEDLGMLPSDEEVEYYRRAVGKTLHDILVDIYGPAIESLYPKIRELKTRHFRELLDLLKPKIPPEVLKALNSRYRMAVVTSTTREQATYMLEKLGIRGLFDALITSEDVRKGKPDPEGLILAKKLLKAEKVLYVGDTDYDREAAKRAGVDYVDVEEFVRSWRSLL